MEVTYSAAPNLSKGNKLAFEDIGAAQNFIIIPKSEKYYKRKDLSYTINESSFKDFGDNNFTKLSESFKKK